MSEWPHAYYSSKINSKNNIHLQHRSSNSQLKKILPHGSEAYFHFYTPLEW